MRERVRVRRRRFPHWRRYALAAVAAIALLFVLALAPAGNVRDRMAQGRDLLTRGRDALLSGDPAVATAAFREAEDRFVQALGHAGNPLLRFGSWLPILGRTPDGAVGLATAGREVAAAGTALSAGLSGLPDGLGSLGPRGGRIPVESLRDFAPAVEAAAAHLQRAESEVDQVPRGWLLGPVAEARSRFETELEPLGRGISAAALIVDRLPAFLGADGPRRYLFAAENPAELRGTGGLVGSVSVMTARDGRITFSPFVANENFPKLPVGEVEPPHEDYARRYPDASGFMVVANLTPDAPSAATALERLYERSRGVALDGAILADPFALQEMLTVSGAVEHPVVGRVTHENVVPLVTNRAYALLGSSRERSAVLGEVARVVIARFLRGAPPAEAAQVLAGAAAGGHLTIHTADARLQEGLARAGADGALPPPGSDVLGVIVNNGGANKIDFFAERTVNVRTVLGAGGAARSDVEVTIHNRAPTSGQHPYVIGPNRVSERGENISLVDLFTGGGTELLAAGLNGDPAGVGEDLELGHTVFPTSVSIPSGDTAELTYAVARDGAWRGSPSEGVYRLTVLGQSTIVPTRASIEIVAPEGTRIVRSTAPLRVADNRAVWEGELARDMTFEVEFQKPFPARAWNALTEFFSKRLITF